MRRLYLIELFAGSHSVSKALTNFLGSKFDLRVLSVDIDPKTNASVVGDINKWNYERDIDEFLRSQRANDIVLVHASPPCTAFSRANTTGIRDIEGGSKNVKRALEIIKFVDPHIWTLENPVGLLREQPFMKRLEKYINTTCYCKFRKPYKKPTNIWSNVEDLDLPMCDSQTPCPHKAKFGHHSHTAQSGDTSNGKSIGSGGGRNVYPIPSALVRHVYSKGLLQLRR